jgi:hypothetical protein
MLTTKPSEAPRRDRAPPTFVAVLARLHPSDDVVRIRSGHAGRRQTSPDGCSGAASEPRRGRLDGLEVVVLLGPIIVLGNRLGTAADGPAGGLPALLSDEAGTISIKEIGTTSA